MQNYRTHSTARMQSVAQAWQNDGAHVHRTSTGYAAYDTAADMIAERPFKTVSLIEDAYNEDAAIAAIATRMRNTEVAHAAWMDNFYSGTSDIEAAHIEALRINEVRNRAFQAKADMDDAYFNSYAAWIPVGETRGVYEKAVDKFCALSDELCALQGY